MRGNRTSRSQKKVWLWSEKSPASKRKVSKKKSKTASKRKVPKKKGSKRKSASKRKTRTKEEIDKDNEICSEWKGKSTECRTNNCWYDYDTGACTARRTLEERELFGQ